MSNITLNIVEPASPTPVDPGTGTVVPDTGLFTSGTSGAEAAIIATVTLVVILAIIGAFIYYKKKQGKTPSLFTRFKHTKSTTGLAVLALMVSIATVAGLVKLTTSAIEGDEAQSAEDSSALTVDVSSTEFTIELADQPVFAVLPVDITVEEATDLGYTLTAFAEDTNLVSTTDSSKVIPMVTVDAEDVEDIDEEASEEESLDSSLVALSPNTYGLSFTDPESALDEVYTSLSTDIDNPTFITDKDYEATLENNTTTIYYGFYITPDTPYGTYTGSNISVDATANIATVTFDANGLYFNDSEEATENTVGYKPNIAESPIEEVVGEYLTPAPLTTLPPTHYTFLGWSEDKDATTPTYTNEEDILANLTLAKNESLTLYAVWHYDTVLSFNGTTSDGGTSMQGFTIAAGDTITLPPNTFTRTGSVFIGWNTAADGSGEAYADEASFTAPNESADITLYAQWAYTTTITFNGNGATGGTMSPQTVIAGTPQSLTVNNFTKTNATFIGWNTQANGSGTSYSDEAEYTASTEEHQDITLYAQWAYTTISFNGNTSDAGTMNPITIAGGTTSNLPAKAFIKNNCVFTGWNTESAGTGISYGDSTPYTANATTIESFTLYAQWQCISQVNYRGNGATGGEMASSIVLGGSTLTFPQNTFTRNNYTFIGWNTVANPTPENPGTSYPDQGSFTAPMAPATTLNLYAQWLPTTTITFNGNGETSGSMADQTIVAGTPQSLTPNAYAKDGYIFTGWNTVQTPTPDNPGTVYVDQARYTASTTQPDSFTLYAQWVLPLTFTAGSHIDTLMVADSSQNWKPFYVTPTSTDRSIIFTAPAEGTKYIITVVPEAGYVLSSDSTNSSYEADFSTGTLASNTLLTTTYTAGSAGDNITISAAQAGSDSAHSAYTTMQSLTVAECPAYTDSAQGINVTDSRNNESYTVSKFGNYCYMLSNLRLINKKLTTSTSNVSVDYILPGTYWYNDYCTPNMSYRNGEYYYNWPAATARTNSTHGTSDCSNDTSNSVGDICPAGWSLPTYQDITPDSLWNSGANPGMLSTAGIFYSSSQSDVGNSVGYWSNTRRDKYGAYRLSFNGTRVIRSDVGKRYGYPVRCMRSS